MTGINPDIFGASIVVVGSFNPPIFSPAWLSSNGLIGPDDEKAAIDDKGHVVSREITRYNTGRFQIQVLEGQLSIGSTDAVSPALRDLAVGILMTVAHTPVTAIGLNFHGHYKMPTIKNYHNVGDVLAPKRIWSEVLGVSEENTGLFDITVGRLEEGRAVGVGERRTNLKKYNLQPSGTVKPGVYMSVNDHRVVEATSDESSATVAAKIADRYWEETWKESLEIFSSLLTKAMA